MLNSYNDLVRMEFHIRNNEYGDKNRETNNKHLTDNILGKGKDTKKNVKKEATKTPKEKKAEKRLKKS